MNTNYSENNHLILVGKIVSEQKYSHEIYGEKFYKVDLEVVRLSSNMDIIPITISERLITGMDLSIGKFVKVEGQFRSYNSYENEKNRLILTVFAKEISEAEAPKILKDKKKENEENETVEKEAVEKSDKNEVTNEATNEITNEVTLIGYICKKPIYRQTPFGREIADILLAVNRAYNKSDYIPCISWGRNARFCQNIEVGTEVKIVGRVQSRSYEKKYEDGTSETRVAYEVSIASMEVMKSEDAKTEVSENEESQEAI